MEKYRNLLQNFQLFSGIDRQELEAMLHCLDARIVDYKKGAYILRSGGSIDALGLILEGRILIIQEDFWGNRNILSAIGRGQSFGESFACAPGSILTVSASADTDCRVMFLNVGHILTLCPESCSHHHRMIRNLLSNLAGKNLYLNEKLSHLGQRTTRSKILSYLSEESQKQGSVEFDIPYSRQQLADYLYVDRSGLSLELSKMQKEGLLEYHRNHFRLNG